MAGGSMRQMKAKSDKYQSNVEKRGKVPAKSKKENDLGVSQGMIYFFVFVVVGSMVVQIVSNL